MQDRKSKDYNFTIYSINLERRITRNLRIIDHKNWNDIANCGYYNKFWGLRNVQWALGLLQLGPLIKTKIYKPW